MSQPIQIWVEIGAKNLFSMSALVLKYSLPVRDRKEAIQNVSTNLLGGPL